MIEVFKNAIGIEIKSGEAVYFNNGLVYKCPIYKLVKLHSKFKGSPKENIGKLVRIIKPYLKTPTVKECRPQDLISGVLYKHQTGRYYKMIVGNISIDD